MNTAQILKFGFLALVVMTTNACIGCNKPEVTVTQEQAPQEDAPAEEVIPEESDRELASEAAEPDLPPTPLAPVAVPTPAPAPKLNTAPIAVSGVLDLNFNALGTFSGTDADGDDLTFILVDQPPAAAGSVELLDARKGDYAFFTAARFGVVTFTFKVSDGQTESNTATITVVHPDNRAPAVIDTGITIDEDNAGIDLVTGTDADNDPLTFNVVTAPANGSVNMSADGNFTYQPDTDFNGADSFTYRATDGKLNSNVATATITINAINDAPTLSSIADQTVDEDMPVNLTFEANEGGLNDEDTQTLSVTATSSNQTLVPDSNLTPTCDDLGDGCSATLDFTPALNESGTAIITVTVSDGLLTDQVSFNLTVNAVDDAPIAWNLAVTTSPDAGVAVTLWGGDAEGATVTYTIADAPTNGVLTGTPPDMTYTPNPGFTGNDQFTYTTDDGGLQSIHGTVRILVGGNAIFVVANPAALGATDQAVFDRMQAIGINVTLIDDNTSATSDADGMDLIVISSSTGSANVNTKFTASAVPVMTWERFLYDDLQMTGAEPTDNGIVAAQTDIEVTDDTHPLSGGFTGITTVFDAAGDMVWGTLNGNAQVVATIAGDPTRPVLFVYEKDVVMAGGLTAPARRVGYFLPDNSNAPLSADGISLLDAALFSALTPSP